MSKKNPFEYIGKIKVERDSQVVQVAKLVGVSQYQISFFYEGDIAVLGSHDYQLPSFQSDTARITLISNLVVGYINGANYKLTYKKLAPEEQLTEHSFYHFVVQRRKDYPKSGEYPQVTQSRPIDPCVQGILIKIERIDK